MQNKESYGNPYAKRIEHHDRIMEGALNRLDDQARERWAATMIPNANATQNPRASQNKGQTFAKQSQVFSQTGNDFSRAGGMTMG